MTDVRVLMITIGYPPDEIGGTEVYVLDAESLRWTRVPAAATNDADPGPGNSTGTFGRFRYVASLGQFVLVNSAEQDVFVYRADSAH